MYKALKNLSATEQIGALFIIVFGLLLLAGIVVFLLSMRESEDANTSHRRSCDIENLSKPAQDQLDDDFRLLGGLDLR
jgi:phosphatidate cytidylyltransferase